ncbi:MAG: hypothetical protein KJ970_15115 [Candidatus Eisenbacteria bacterium]|uniref:Uncharacterized protein n=1 Tax=Eiseniibacteriota bacterium TaxID=2212470 RepID=A0A948RYE4_UNCEI|nr:hypothetical protein [Candidatus Eisenbacteria bacterium]MBU1948358.1 hypothetical protein [Candidatus Eisenbacteria bacterium]MBU2692251.1 hypothetical protein [Candidatus Eisenbacteria bacterium]
MKFIIILLFGIFLFSETCAAGTNNGVVLIADGSLRFPCGGSSVYPWLIDPTSCEEADPAGEEWCWGLHWFHLFAASPIENNTRIGGFYLGLGQYDQQRLYIDYFGAAVSGSLITPTSGWPGPGSGTIVDFRPYWISGEYELLCYFGAYVYGEDDITIPLANHPDHLSGVFDEDGEFDEFVGLPAMGFAGHPGSNPLCPGEEPTLNKVSTWGSIKSLYSI